MPRLYIAIGILAVVAMIGLGGWAVINKLNRQAATIAVQDVQIKTQSRQIFRLQVSIGQKAANNDALRRDKDNSIRTQRADTNAFRKGLNDETHTPNTYINSLNRAIAGSLNSLQGATARDKQPDNHPAR